MISKQESNKALNLTLDRNPSFASAPVGCRQVQVSFALGDNHMIERVYSVWDFYDRPRTGIADFNGETCHFECGWDEVLDDYSDAYQVRALNDSIRVLATEYDQIWREWEKAFHAGKTSGETHPSNEGQNPRFTELTKSLDSAIKKQNIVATKAAEFRIMRGQENLPAGVVREMEVEWHNVT